MTYWTVKGARITLHKATSKIRCDSCENLIPLGERYVEINTPKVTREGVVFVTTRFCKRCWKPWFAWEQ